MKSGAHVAPLFTTLHKFSAGMSLLDGMPNLRNVFGAYGARPGSTLLDLKHGGGTSPLFLREFLSLHVTHNHKGCL